uniref:Uncharacterized protein n=1 Tax=Cajanus cajan TaxID=3821 RepID=A0A151TBZ6_CAJCA|nr:hypothetical protein KK1_019134 [Cajanus cajan]
MANSKLGFMVSFILLNIMVFHVTFSALGRPLLKSEMKEHENSIQEMATWHNPQHDAVRKWTVDDFQPTDPGHSPGAGHSSPHADVAPNP